MKKQLLGMIVLLVTAFGALVPGAMACCSVAPAEFHDTTGWVGEFHRNGKVEHLLAYENVAVNKNLYKGSDGTDAVHGNAMLLPIPAVPNTMNEKNLLDGRDFKGVVESVYKSSRDPITVAMDTVLSQTNSLNSFSAKMDSEPVHVQVFDKGSYTVVLSSSAKAIPDVVARIPANKRPPINKELFEAYDKWYPGWSFALCCFDRSVGDPEPLVWWYEPKDPNVLFFPAVDEHSGAVPEMNTMVAVDHKLAVTSDQMLPIPDGFGAVHPVHYDGYIGPSAHNYAPLYCIGNKFSGQRLQGDFTFNAWDVRAGLFRPHRTPPPGAEANMVLPLFSDLAEDQYSRIWKVLTGWFLAGWVILFFRRWWTALALIVLSPALLFFNASVLGQAPNAVSDLASSGVLHSVLYVALAVVPILFIAQNSFASSWKLQVATVGVVAAGFMFPGWSAVTYPLWWAVLAIFSAINFSATESKRKPSC